MMRVGSWVLGVMLAVGAAGGVVRGQQAEASVAPGTSVPATSVGGVLRGMAARAGVVFVGQVLRIEPKGGAVEVTFQVQQAVLGVVGGTYVMREWAGRWTGGQQRYWVGQRAMFFLHAPSVSPNGGAGLSSPVDGMMGVVPLVPMGANAGALLDARRLAARVRRPVGAPLADAATGAIALADAVTVTANWQTRSVPEPKSVGLPVGVRPQPVRELTGESSQLEQSRVHGLLQAQEQSDARP
jgi:hypothetical protein